MKLKHLCKSIRKVIAMLGNAATSKNCSQKRTVIVSHILWMVESLQNTRSGWKQLEDVNIGGCAPLNFKRLLVLCQNLIMLQNIEFSADDFQTGHSKNVSDIPLSLHSRYRILIIVGILPMTSCSEVIILCQCLYTLSVYFR